MNILLFVTTMLMLLALMTYGRLETYRSLALVQSQFEYFMTQTERLYVNNEAKKRYKNTTASTKEKIENAERNGASATLSFNLFVDKEERAKYADKLEAQIEVAKNLLCFLYGNQKFFIDMQERRPDFLSEIFAKLIAATDQYTKKEKLASNKVKEIATVNLEDPELNVAFGKMLKGLVIPKEKKAKKDQSVSEQTTPFRPKEGYLSLLDFITIQKNKLKIRVYLASSQLLMALYGNPEVVQQILETRYDLYRQYVNDVIAKEAAEKEFQALFLNQRLDIVPSDMLDFGISKTNPNLYR